MYFHVYAAHSSQVCPMYTPEKMPQVFSAWEKFRPLADELGSSSTIGIHSPATAYLLVGVPTHRNLIPS